MVSYSIPSMIPIIKLNNLSNLSEIINSHGFFYMEYSSEDAKVINESFEQAKLFFNQNIETKTKNIINLVDDEYLGYRPLKKIKLDNNDIIKYSETYNYRPGNSQYEINKIYEKCYNIMLNNAINILDQILKILNVTEKYEFYNTLHLIHYPESDNNELLGIPEHSDWGFLTLLITTEEGLQIKIKDEWINAPVIENHFIVNFADMLELLSDGKFQSTKHRVITKKEKYSIVFFFEPSLDTTIKNIRFGDYLKSNMNVLYDESF